MREKLKKSASYFHLILQTSHPLYCLPPARAELSLHYIFSSLLFLAFSSLSYFSTRSLVLLAPGQYLLQIILPMSSLLLMLDQPRCIIGHLSLRQTSFRPYFLPTLAMPVQLPPGQRLHSSSPRRLIQCTLARRSWSCLQHCTRVESHRQASTFSKNGVISLRGTVSSEAGLASIPTLAHPMAAASPGFIFSTATEQDTPPPRVSTTLRIPVSLHSYHDETAKYGGPASLARRLHKAAANWTANNDLDFLNSW